MVKPVVGDIVAIRFPFSDLSTVKLRPALVLALVDHGDYVVCQITSKPYSSSNAIRLLPAEAAGMHITSYIRPDKIFTADLSLIEKGVAKISKAKLKETKASIKAIFEL